MMSPVCRKVQRNNQCVFCGLKPLMLSFMILVGALLACPRLGVTATVDYNSNFKDVMGNAPFLNGPIGYGGTNNLASHSDNIYSYGNTVNINGGIVDFAIYGGYYNGTIPGGDVGSNNNTVTINPAFVGSSTNDVYGGFAKNVDPGSMTASGNTVNINGGTTRNIYGGFAYVGSLTGTGSATASSNIVNISAGTMNSVYGGNATVDHLGGTHAASGNTVNISGGTVSNIYGGSVSAPNGTGQAINNTVTISGTPNLAAASLYGGYLVAGTAGEAFSGNTLNIKTTGLTVNNVYNFQYLNFYLPSTVSSGDTVMTVTGTADLTGSSGRSSTVNVGINGSASPLKMGDTITLIDAGTLVTNSNLKSTASGTGMQGVTLLYHFDITKDNNKLLATVSTQNSSSGPTVNERTKALSEGFVSGLGMVAQGADVAAGQGMNSAVSAAKAGSAAGGSAPAGFGALSGGSVRYNTGSHVDMHSVSLLAGLAWGANSPLGRLTFGPFFEYGSGSYSTYNSFSNAASVQGDGDTRYIGGGLLARMDFANSGPGHVYVEGSGRAGGLHNKYESSDLRDAAGRCAEYDSSSTYYGLHLGTGYVWNITDDASIDLYGKYFWTRQKGDSVTLSTGDPIDFKDVDSNRLRLGSRFSYRVNDYISPYAGAAYEREFDGKARATTNGYDMKAPSMRGDTGVGELGLVFTPCASLPLSFDLGVQGYVGKREGVTGSMQAKYEF